MLRNSVVYFMEVARIGSIRAASASLGVAQSAISRQIQALEYEIGAPVIERYSHGVRLTPSGEALFRHARLASYEIERLVSELDDMRGTSHSRVHVAVVESLTSYVFPRAIKAFLDRYPDNTLIVEVGKSDAVLEAVMRDAADFGVCVNAPSSAAVDVLARFAEPLFAIVPPNHPLCYERQIGLAELSKHPLALSSRSTGVGYALDLACSKAELSLEATLETNSIELLRQFVSSGCGIAVMTRQSCLGSLLESHFTALRIQDIHLDMISSDVVVAQGRKLPLPSERFMSSVMAELKRSVQDSSTPVSE
ncbi:MAG: LysR family transcriptional regulator [Microvirga sp.]|jgi:DNA-binding transcriptional LysR family regulator|nr:LysR family transcriptional regulator [Microvirga sp.]